MSLRAYLLHYDDEFVRYYNCNAYDVNSIPIEERSHLVPGLIIVAIGLLAEFCYIPCIYAMLQPSLRAMSIYNQMLYYALMEVVGIAVYCIFYGWMYATGVAYCHYPRLIFYISTLQITLWYMQCQVLVQLAVNRCLVIYDMALADKFFSSWVYTTVWVGLPPAVGLAIAWFAPPMIANGRGLAQYFNPHFGYLPDDPYYNSPPLMFYYQVYLIAALISIYTLFALLFYKKFHHHRSQIITVGVGVATAPGGRQSEGTLNKMELVTFVQIAVINFSLVIAICGIITLGIVQKLWLVVPATYMGSIWYGSSGIVYLTMNHSIKKEVCNAYKRLRRQHLTSHVNALSVRGGVTASKPGSQPQRPL